MNRQELFEICYRAAYEFPQAYMESGWVPHEWVLEAVEEAYSRGLYRNKPGTEQK